VAKNDPSAELERILSFQSLKELEALDKIIKAADASNRVHELQVKITLEMRKWAIASGLGSSQQRFS